MKAHWKSHTVRETNYLWDISPRSIGNLELLPTNTTDIRPYYNFIVGGDKSPGNALNPHTEEPYSEQWVPRSDYTTIIAEFWADGPQSETPPGHWYTILNYISDRDELIKKYKGEGIVLTDLEWDVRSYFVLGGAMHDAAIAAWSSKGYYDYIRPISAIRYLADQGQSSDSNLPNYSPNGILLVPNSIELIDIDDPLLNFDQSNLNRIKIKGFIREDDSLFTSGDLWLSYQSPNFVTPPFADYVSGHSTFSRAAAEVLAEFTGDPFFLEVWESTVWRHLTS